MEVGVNSKAGLLFPVWALISQVTYCQVDCSRLVLAILVMSRMPARFFSDASFVKLSSQNRSQTPFSLFLTNQITGLLLFLD